MPGLRLSSKRLRIIALNNRPFYRVIAIAEQVGMLVLGKMKVSGIWPKSWLLRQERKSRSLRVRYGESSGMESRNASKAIDSHKLRRALCMRRGIVCYAWACMISLALAKPIVRVKLAPQLYEPIQGHLVPFRSRDIVFKYGECNFQE